MIILLLINHNYHFVPFAVETMGAWGTDAIKFFNQRTKSFLIQKISVTIQKTNAASVMGMLIVTEKMKEIF